MNISRNFVVTALVLCASVISYVQAKNDKCTAPSGIVLRGYGKNLAPNSPNVFVKCAAFDQCGCQVG